MDKVRPLGHTVLVELCETPQSLRVLNTTLEISEAHVGWYEKKRYGKVLSFGEKVRGLEVDDMIWFDLPSQRFDDSERRLILDHQVKAVLNYA